MRTILFALLSLPSPTSFSSFLKNSTRMERKEVKERKERIERQEPAVDHPHILGHTAGGVEDVTEPCQPIWTYPVDGRIWVDLRQDSNFTIGRPWEPFWCADWDAVLLPLHRGARYSAFCGARLEPGARS